MSAHDFAVSLFSNLYAAASPLALGWIVETIRARTRASRRADLVETTKKRMEMFRTYYETQSLVLSGAQLDAVRDHVAEVAAHAYGASIAALAEVDEQDARRRSLFPALLLPREMRSARANKRKTWFHVFAALSVASWTLAAMATVSISKGVGDFVATLIGMYVVTVPFWGPAIWFRERALMAEREEAKAPGASTVPRSQSDIIQSAPASS